ncbi:hypothetical protein D9M68_365420 [compost metagenome]
MPRLDMARNARRTDRCHGTGGVILGQQLSPLQLLGGSLVVGGIVLLAYKHQK